MLINPLTLTIIIFNITSKTTIEQKLKTNKVEYDIPSAINKFKLLNIFRYIVTIDKESKHTDNIAVSIPRNKPKISDFNNNWESFLFEIPNIKAMITDIIILLKMNFIQIENIINFKKFLFTIIIFKNEQTI